MLTLGLRGAKGSKRLQRLFKTTTSFPRYSSNLRTLIENAFEKPHTIDPLSLPLKTFRETSQSIEPVKDCKLLTRDFIDDSLYNPNYGYFSKQAVIYSPNEVINFNKLRDSLEFMNEVALRYENIEKDLSSTNDIARQLWHTPTELFKPYYGYSIANYIVTKFMEKGYKELIIYEMGAGNGTLMLNIMDYIHQHHPTIYKNTKYHIIEISDKLVTRQRKNHKLNMNINLHNNVDIIHSSIFDFEQNEINPCFFIGLEVLDNFAHDVVKFDKEYKPYEELVLIDKEQNYELVYQPVKDDLISEYLTTLKSIDKLPSLDWAFKTLPFQYPLSKSYFMPTKSYTFIKKIIQQMPQHHLILSDFYQLDNTMPGDHAPVVQTRFQNTMVPCQTYLVAPGWFDIFFPTNFETLKDVYHHLSPTSNPQVLSNRGFLETYAQLDDTKTKSGENPLLEYYMNNKFLLS